MTDQSAASARATADRVIELEEEVEASGYATFEAGPLERARAALHKWVDEMTGVVISPGLGRVTVIHGERRPATIASAHLSQMMSRPAARNEDA